MNLPLHAKLPGYVVDITSDMMRRMETDISTGIADGVRNSVDKL